MELEIFFWTTGMEYPVLVSLGEGIELTGSFVIIHSGYPGKTGFNLFYDFLSVSNRYNKLAKFTWQKDEESEVGGSLAREDFVFPNLPAVDPHDWRSYFLLSDSSIDTERM